MEAIKSCIVHEESVMVLEEERVCSN